MDDPLAAGALDAARKRGWRRWYSRGLFLAVLVSLGWYLASHVREIVGIKLVLRWPFLVASIVLLILSFLLMLWIWLRIAGSLGLQAPPGKTARSFYLSQLGKYVPSNLGLFLLRLELYSGYAKSKVALGCIVEYVVSFLAMCIVPLVGLALVPESLPPWLRGLSIAGAVGAMIVLVPPVFRRLATFGLGVLRVAVPQTFPGGRDMSLFFIGHLAVSVLYGLVFAFLVAGLHPVAPQYFLPLAGVYCAVTNVGILLPFAPGGLGVREGVLFLVLPALLPQTTVIVAGLLMRLVCTGVELLMAGCAYGLPIQEETA